MFRSHRPHRGFGHGKAGWPLLVTAAHVFVPGVGDERIFRALARFAGEDQRLVGHHAKFGHDGSRFICEHGHHGVHGGAGPAIVGAAGDEEQRGGSGYFRGLDDGHPVLPDGPVHFLGFAPRLRRHVEERGRTAARARQHAGDVVTVAGVRLADVPVQGRFGGEQRKRK